MRKLPLYISLLFITFYSFGCAKIWSPVFWVGKKTNPQYYEKPVYYDNPHDLCVYRGPHIHDPEANSAVSVPKMSKKEILKKYRYPGMEERFKDMDDRVW